MGDKILFAVVIAATLRSADYKGPPVREKHTIHVYTNEGALVAGKMAVDWLGDGWMDKEIEGIQKIGHIVLF